MNCMKKIILLLLVIGFHQSVFAKVLKVKEYGVDGSYSSISLAVSASRPQDTIILYPKKFGLPFLESNLIIPHQIYFFNSDSSRFKFNFPVELNNCNVTNAIFSSYSVIKNATVVNCDFLEEIEIFNAELISCIANKRVSNSTIKSNISILGCKINEFIPSNGFNNVRLVGNKIEKIVDFNFVGDSIEIIANQFNNWNIDYNFFVFQPKIFGIMASNVFNLAFYRGWGCNTSGFNWSNNGLATVSNNFFNVFNKSNHNSPCQEGFFSSLNNGYLVNNVIFYKDNGQFTYFSRTTLSNSSNGITKGNLLITNRNYNNYGSYWDTIGWATYENKFLGGVNSLNLDSNGIFVDSNLTVNKGVVIPQYLDIDLSVPDIGPYGGPMPITNFLNLDAQKAKVLYLQLPQKVFSPSSSIPIRATGATK